MGRKRILAVGDTYRNGSVADLLSGSGQGLAVRRLHGAE